MTPSCKRSHRLQALATIRQTARIAPMAHPPSTIHRPRRSLDFACVVALLLLPCAKYWPLLLEGETLHAVDIANYFYPFKTYVGRALAEGRVPLWDPDVLCGFPLHASSQMGVLYPLNLLFALPIPVSMTSFVLGHLALMGGLAFALLRQLNRSRLSAMLGATVLVFNTYTQAQVVNLNLLTGAAWFPLAVLLLARGLGANRFGLSLGAGAVLGLQFLCGHPQEAVYSGCALAGLAAVWIVKANVSARARCRRLAGAWLGLALGVSVALPQILPSLEFAPLSTRAGGLSYDEAASGSLPPAQTAALLVPRAFGAADYGYRGAHNPWELHIYAGILALALAVFAVVRCRHRWVAAFAVLGLVALVLSFGRHTPMGQVLRLPGLNAFRMPCRWLAFVAFSIAMLAAFGLDELAGLLPRVGRGGILPPAQEPGRLLYFIVACLAFADTWHAGGIEVNPCTPAGFLVKEPAFVAGCAEARDGYRIVARKISVAAFARLDDLAVTDYRPMSTIPATLNRVMTQLGEGRAAILLCGRYIVDATKFSMRSPGRFAVFGVRNARRRFETAERARRVSDAGQAIGVLASLRDGLERAALVESPRDLPHGEAALSHAQFAPHVVSARASAVQAATLLLNDTHYPGWRAYVNGRREGVLRANGFARALVLPPGDSTVAFVFQPRSFALGLFGGLVALASMAVFWTIARLVRGCQVSGFRCQKTQMQ